MVTTRKHICTVNFFLGYPADLCVFVCVSIKTGCNTFFAASSCSRRISDPFSLISFSLISNEELRSRERSPWSLPEVGTAWPPPPSTLDSDSGSRSTNLYTSTNIIVSKGTKRFPIRIWGWFNDNNWLPHNFLTMSWLLCIVCHCVYVLIRLKWAFKISLAQNIKLQNIYV